MTTSTTEPQAMARVERLRVDLAAAGQEFVGAVKEIAPLAQRIADLEAELTAAEHIAGVYRMPMSSPRELATEILAGFLQGLRPFLRPVTTRETALRAVAQLTAVPGTPKRRKVKS